MRHLHPLQLLSALPFLLSVVLLSTADPIFGKGAYALGLLMLAAGAAHARMSADIVELHPYAVCALLAGPWLLYSLAVTTYGLFFAFAALTTKEIWAGAYYRQRLWERRGKRSKLPAKVNAYHAAATMLILAFTLVAVMTASNFTDNSDGQRAIDSMRATAAPWAAMATAALIASGYAHRRVRQNTCSLSVSATTALGVTLLLILLID